MNSPRRQSIRVCVAGLVLPALIGGGGLAGCANMSDDQKTGTAVGAGTGAVIGGVAGALLGKKKNKAGTAVVGAGIGALVGGAIGSEIGKRVNEKRQKYKDDDAFLRQQLADAKRDRAAAEREQSELAMQVQDLKQRHAAAAASNDLAMQGKVRTEASTLRAQADARQKALDEQIAFNEESARAIRAQPRGQVSGERLADLDRETAELKQQKVALAQDFETLAKL